MSAIDLSKKSRKSQFLSLLDLPKKLRKSQYFSNQGIVSPQSENRYRLTPIILTFYEGLLTDIDIERLLEMDVHIVRFRMTHVGRSDKIRMLKLLQKAINWVCDKYDVGLWPIAVMMDIPNACIRSGYADENIPDSVIKLEKKAMVEITSNVRYWNKCTPSRIFMDDPDTLKSIVVGIEISFLSCPTVVVCTEVIDSQTIHCKVIRSGTVINCDFICARGLHLKRPALLKKDLELLSFARECKLDIVTLNNVRQAPNVKKVRKYLSTLSKDYKPFVMSSIGDQEGVDHFDDILQAGKPFFVSGGVMSNSLSTGELVASDLSDVTNAVIQGAGFVIRNYTSSQNLIKSMVLLNDMCLSVESTAMGDDYYRLVDSFKVPTNAAMACIMGCAQMVRQTNALVVIIPTVTGRTAEKLSHVSSDALIITVTRDPAAARRMHIHKGIISVVYDKEHNEDWYQEMESRIQFVVNYGVKKHFLKYGDPYVTLCKSCPTSAYCDCASMWSVNTKETDRIEVHCEEDYDPKDKSGHQAHLLGVGRKHKIRRHHKQHDHTHDEHDHNDDCCSGMQNGEPTEGRKYKHHHRHKQDDHTHDEQEHTHDDSRSEMLKVESTVVDGDK